MISKLVRITTAIYSSAILIQSIKKEIFIIFKWITPKQLGQLWIYNQDFEHIKQEEDYDWKNVRGKKRNKNKQLHLRVFS